MTSPGPHGAPNPLWKAVGYPGPSAYRPKTVYTGAQQADTALQRVVVHLPGLVSDRSDATALREKLQAAGVSKVRVDRALSNTTQRMGMGAVPPGVVWQLASVDCFCRKCVGLHPGRTHRLTWGLFMGRTVAMCVACNVMRWWLVVERGEVWWLLC